MNLLGWMVKHGRLVTQVLGTLVLIGLVLRLWPLLLIAAVQLGLLALALRGPHAFTRRHRQ